MSPDLLADAVLVEPLAQPGPRADQCLVRQVVAAVRRGHEAAADQQVEEATAHAAEGRHDGGGQRRAEGLTALGQRDQVQHQPAQLATLVGAQTVVQALGGGGDRVADAPGRTVAVDGQQPALAAPPGLGEGV